MPARGSMRRRVPNGSCRAVLRRMPWWRSAVPVDLALSAGCFLALGLGLIPRNAVLELFLTLTYAGWGVAWRAVLAADRSPAACRHRLRHWVVFLAVALTATCGMAL